jgi:uncharacterized protein YggU (UPF0235/DUF167 family)
VKVSVRVRPGARADIVGGHWDGPRGPALLVAVRARAVVAFGVRRGDVALVSGARGRDKVVAVEGDEAVLAARHTALLG